MAARLVTVPPPSDGVYRLARRPADPFAPPDWHLADDDGTFGNRFDDPTAAAGIPPERRFRVIYCATQRIAAFGETVARFRPSLSLLNRLASIEDDEPLDQSLYGAVDPEDPHRGLITAEWRVRRCVGHTTLHPTLAFVDITAGETIQHLRTTLAPLAAQLGLNDIDLSSLTSQQRRFTQACARHIYDQLDDLGQPRFAGIRYPSRLNNEWECWAVFDDRIRHEPGCPDFPVTIVADDMDLQRTAELFNLTIEVISGHGNYIRP